MTRPQSLWHMLLCSLCLLLLPSLTHTTLAEQVTNCKATSAEGKICDYIEGNVCRNGSCISSCATRGLLKCECPLEDDKYCYLCCGSNDQYCRPAHMLHVLRPNGEYWERDSCRRCRSLPDGLPCDDRDNERLCDRGKCTNRICYDKREGEYCDMQKDKICVDYQCVNPCPESRVCECPDLDPDTGMRSDDRCTLCCYNYVTKRCESAYKRSGVKNERGQPIARIGLTCKMGMKQCNRYGLCGTSGASSLWPGCWLTRTGLTLAPLLWTRWRTLTDHCLLPLPPT